MRRQKQLMTPATWSVTTNLRNRRSREKSESFFNNTFRGKTYHLPALLRWDAQRMRQEEQLQKLRARQEKKSLGQSKSKSDFNCQRTSLLPALDEISTICVEENIPVSIFGWPLPDTGAKDFSLPWLWVRGRESMSVTWNHHCWLMIWSDHWRSTECILMSIEYSLVTTSSFKS